jgi:Protein of unknown function (DUF3237)
MTQLKEAFRITVKLQPSIDVGPVPTGIRRVIPLAAGGHFEGENLRGEVLPYGADWNLIQPTGIMFVSARYMLKTDDGVVISILNEGTAHISDEMMSKIMSNTLKPGDEGWYCMLQPRFEAPAGKYQWLNERVFICEMLPPPQQDTVLLIVSEVTR